VRFCLTATFEQQYYIKVYYVALHTNRDQHAFHSSRTARPTFAVMSAQNPSIVHDPEWLYRQLPLEELEVRLLRLEPSKGPSSEIRASLFKYDMRELK
jgi:hypothetical protein